MKIICLHQSSDLYGSDRSFLQVVEYLVVSGRFNKITVVLPRTGPLADKLTALKVDVIFIDLSLMSKTYLKSLRWGKIIFPLLSFNKKQKLIEQHDILYVNTSVILDFYLLAPFLKLRKIIHIREIPNKWLSKVLSQFISRSDSLVIFNSHSTKASFGHFSRHIVIHNAFEGYSYGDTEKQRAETDRSDRPLNILLIGRINSWKGQDFAINALSKLSNSNFRLRIVGSPSSGNEDLVVHLKELATRVGMAARVEFIDFIADPSEEYRNTDLLIVPSIKPEPFGRIAIEAMSLGKPVIASNQGGLPEIVEHNRNGFLFTPGDEDSFNGYVQQYLDNRALLSAHGEVSRHLFLTKFSVDIMHKHLSDVFSIDHLLNQNSHETV